MNWRGPHPPQSRKRRRTVALVILSLLAETSAFVPGAPAHRGATPPSPGMARGRSRLRVAGTEGDSETTTPGGHGFLRWRATSHLLDRRWEMQTAVRTLTNGARTVHLHALIHFGAPEYFEHCNRLPSTVLYELLVDEALMESESPTSRGLRRLKPGVQVQATPKDRQLARQYGWACQADVIRYNPENWIHADLSTQEFLRALSLGDRRRQTGDDPPSLWELARADRFPVPAMEAATALMVGPPFLSKKTNKRRLFSNLFVSGSNLTNLLRAFLWLTVPCPELSILLLDWSSLTTTAVSPITVPLAEALVRAQFASARKLVFGQVALLASKVARVQGRTEDGHDLLISQRNQRAMEVLDRLDPGVTSVSLLYGCNHCPDLQARLVAQGYVPKATEWRTAWSVSLQDNQVADHQDGSSATMSLSALLLLASPVYLTIGAWDWIATWRELVQTPGLSEAAFVSAFYLARHALMYSALSKYLLDWDDGGAETLLEDVNRDEIAM